ncbi:MAG: hypothetical protein Q8Q09_16395 [Deltaproteobacteria bacterium]|nr:hypothetical protein [Deltaproteobacteria bacterium]
MSCFCLLAIGASITACRRADLKPTQLVVRIDSQLVPEQELRAIRVLASRTLMGTPILDRVYEFRDGAFTLPGEIGLYAQDVNDQGIVHIEVRADTTAGQTFTVRAEAQFVPRETRIVPILLTRSCGNRLPSDTCASCTACGCETLRFGDDGGVPTGAYLPVRSGAQNEGCALAQVPEVPRSLEDRLVGPDGRVGYAYAVRRVRFDWPTATNPRGWRTLGYDLDGLCSAGGAANATCRNPGGVVEDGEAGRDNAFASRLGPYLVTNNQVSEAAVNARIALGGATMGLELREYAGGDDGRVELSFLPLAQGHPEGRDGEAPRWDGNDDWALDESLALGPDGRQTSLGFVAGSRLVVRMRSQTGLIFPVENGLQTRFVISGGVVSGGVHCGGRVLGSLQFGGWIDVAQVSRDTVYAGLCSPLQRFAVTTALVQAADLYVVGDGPVNNPNLDCNAISVGFELELSPIRAVTRRVRTAQPSSPCDALGDGGVGDAGDASDAGDAGIADDAGDAGDAGSVGDASTDARPDARG